MDDKNTIMVRAVILGNSQKVSIDLLKYRDIDNE